MNTRSLVGLLTLIAVLAGIAAVVWQFAQRDTAARPSVERDLFGAPVVEQQAPQLPIAGSAPAQSQPAGQPEDKSDVLPQLPVGPQQPGAEPAEPFKLPQITAYA